MVADQKKMLEWLLNTFEQRGQENDPSLRIDLVKEAKTMNIDTTAFTILLSKLQTAGYLTCRAERKEGVFWYVVELMDNALALAKPTKGNTIFISYNHNDKEIAHTMKKKLEENGLEVLMDVDTMNAGEDIKSFIENCVRNSDVTLSLVSRNSLLSAWVAMESVFSFYDEKLRNTKFIPCAIDASFFGRDFVDNALDQVDSELDEIDNLISRRVEKGRGIEDLQNERSRYVQLQTNLPEIVRRLKESLTLDLSGDNFELNFPKILATLEG